MGKRHTRLIETASTFSPAAKSFGDFALRFVTGIRKRLNHRASHGSSERRPFSRYVEKHFFGSRI